MHFVVEGCCIRLLGVDNKYFFWDEYSELYVEKCAAYLICLTQLRASNANASNYTIKYVLLYPSINIYEILKGHCFFEILYHSLNTILS